MATINLSEKNLNKNIKSIIKNNPLITIESTTYTTKIKIPDGDNYLFSKTTTNKNTLITSNVIKKDIKNSNYINEPFKNIVTYFNFNENIPEFIKECVCVDINAAYPTELFKMGLITEKTFKRLESIKKSDRLKAMGMLATNKIIQNIENGELKSIDTITGEFSSVFFKVSYNIGKVLNDIFLSYPNYTFFFWVDGIFIKKEIAPLVVDLIESAGYQCKVEKVINLQKKNNYLVFDKFHHKKKIFEKKIIFLPKKRKKVSQEIWDFINK